MDSRGPSPYTPVVESTLLRSILGRFPTGVAILTAATTTNAKTGLTVSSFNSVSLEPPLVLWSINRLTPSFQTFRDASCFCANFLSEDQADLARHFAHPAVDKFAAVPHHVHATQVAILADCAAYVVCRTWRQYDGGDHLIIVGEVVDLGASQRIPLVFGLGGFCKLLIDPALNASSGPPVDGADAQVQ